MNPVDIALCDYAEKLTKAPSQMGAGDIQKLREVGLDDRAINDATQVISYFNYINRIADALGIEQEDFVRPWDEEPL